MPGEETVEFLPIAVAVVLVLVAIVFSNTRRIRRAMRKSRLASIRNFPASGPARIVGTLECGDEPLTAPLTGRQCAYYEAILEVSNGTGTGRTWRDGTPGGDRSPFSCRRRDTKRETGIGKRETESAIVDPDGAHLPLVKDSHKTLGSLARPSPEQQAFLHHHVGRHSWWVARGQMRYSEGVLEAGEEVAVVGHRTKALKRPGPGSAPSRGGTVPQCGCVFVALVASRFCSATIRRRIVESESRELRPLALTHRDAGAVKRRLPTAGGRRRSPRADF